MTHFSVTIELLVIILAGFLLKLLYKDKISAKTIETIVIKFFLPILLFTAFSETRSNTHITLLLCFGFSYCIVMGVLFYLLLLHKPYLKKENKISFIATVAAVAPGLSVYPFVDSFLGKSYLPNISMMDFGCKIYIFCIIYPFFYIFLEKLKAKQCGDSSSNKLNIFHLVLSVIKNFAREPVIIAIILGLIFFLSGTTVTQLSPTASNFLIKLSSVATLLIMIFIGINLYKRYEPQGMIISLSLLLIRSGLGILYAAVVCLCFGLSGQKTLLYTAFTQGAVTIWPYVAITGLKERLQIKAIDDKALLTTFALSFPLSILSMLILFNLTHVFRNYAASNIQLWLIGIGAIITIVFVTIYKITSIRYLSRETSVHH